ncbi:CNKR3 kinase, partial [Acromyrmex insinuator]
MSSLFYVIGLDNTIHPYIHSFLNHDVNGQQLLNIQSQDLERLGVIKLGHQEIILNAVEYLRSFHYELDKENLQLLALRLSSQAHSLHKELCRQKNSESVSTQTLSDVASIMMVVKPLVRWMDYSPFNGHIEYHAKKVELMKISIEMATCAQRDRFAEKPVQEIRTTCSQLATLADYIIQDIVDPMILQPASLDLATLKKKSSDDLGFYILPSFHGVHQITEIKLGSAAHQSGKMMEGDQIVQVNYQTVVGWERKNLLELFRESPAEMLLTIKRRPRHAKVYGKIYIKPYKLPCNRNTSYTTQGRSLPSPRPELLTIPDFAMPSPRHIPKKSGAEPTSILDAVKMLDTMTTDSSDSDSEAETPLYAKRRNLVQRRATITGASPTSKHGINLERFWKELKLEHNAAVQLRDKAASCAHGLDNVPMVNIRPQTCLGLESAKKKNNTNEQTNKKVQFEEKLTDVKSTHPINTKEKITPMQNCDVGVNIVNKDINIEHLQAFRDNVIDSNNLNDTTVPLGECNNSISDTCSINENKRNNKEIGLRHIEKRDKLDKDYTTSAYDLSHIEKLDLFDHCLINKPNNNLTKTNISTVVENVDNKKLKDASSKHKEPSAIRYDGNVARKISDIEKQIAKNECSNNNNNNTSSIEDDSVNVIHNVSKINIKQQTKEAKSADLPPAQVTIQSCRFIELPKIQSIRKLENKSHITPPEPPPRKYYTNQAITDLKLNNVPQTLEDLQKPQVPERLGIKREFKKVDLSLCVNHIRSNSDCQDKKDSSDVLNYTENSMDFIGESRTVSLSDQKFDRLNLSAASLYNENNDKQSREEKCPFEKYETFVEKFVCSDQSITDCYRFDHSHNADCPDGITYSKQTSDLKPRLSEKDKSIEKSVVNKAMMVAKSIGLHSSLNKSNNSPRSSRKRNMLLAKRRNVSVRDVGTNDLEGWLTYRSRGAGGAWAKAWFVLKCSSLYRFKLQDSVKADCLIVLTGFTVSPATEIKSRKYSFKVYHTGTVFYFAADSEDNLIMWLDAVNKGTLGTDTQDQSVELFSETDESDSESHKNKLKCTPQSDKANPEKLFGSLKKSARKDTGSFKDHETGGASLDRKYLKFLSARNQNMPVPTAQFRSYRRVLPTSTPNKKEDCNSNSPDLQMTIAGSTFYGLTTSQNTTDMSNSDMNDYRHATDRKSENLQEEFVTSQQDEQRRTMINKSMSTRATPLLNDHVHVQHRNLNDRMTYNEEIRQLSDTSLNNISNIYGKTSDEMPNNNIMYVHSKNKNAHVYAPCQFIKDNFVTTRSESEANYIHDKSHGKCMTTGMKKVWDSSSYAQKRRVQEIVNIQKPRHDDLFHWENIINPNKQNSPNQSVDYELNKYRQSPNCENNKMHGFSPRNIGHSGSSNDLASHTSSETQQCIKKDASINRKGSFNFANRYDNSSSDKHWLDSLKYNDKKSSNCDKNRLKNVAQYQPPPIPTSPFEQEEMRATFEMHLDKNDHVQKASRLKVLFGTKQQKPCTLELPKNIQKTVSETSSPRLYKALFRDKHCSNQSQHPLSTCSGSPNSDDEINQSHSSFNNNNPSQMFIQTLCSANSVSDPDAITSSIKSKYDSGYSSNYKGFLNSRKNLVPALPYIPPPTSPPPDYPGLEYPPVFEPGTYSLSDTSLLRSRNKSSQNTGQ